MASQLYVQGLEDVTGNRLGIFYRAVFFPFLDMPETIQDLKCEAENRIEPLVKSLDKHPAPDLVSLAMFSRVYGRALKEKPESMTNAIDAYFGTIESDETIKRLVLDKRGADWFRKHLECNFFFGGNYAKNTIKYLEYVSSKQGRTLFAYEYMESDIGWDYETVSHTMDVEFIRSLRPMAVRQWIIE